MNTNRLIRDFKKFHTFRQGNGLCGKFKTLGVHHQEIITSFQNSIIAIVSFNSLLSILKYVNSFFLIVFADNVN
jgi:hypothetical protein